MRFDPEMSDDANKGLGIVRDLLEPIKKRHPEISYADLYVLGGAAAIEFLGGPKIDVKFGRSDATRASLCPVLNGRLPDAAQGAKHLRDVFYRMGFNDRDIVALSGAHTLGRCHSVRSGFDGPWTNNPLRFDNNYFKVLMGLDWAPRDWKGNFQYEDKLTKSLMMLPTDMALKTDPKFKVWAMKYVVFERVFENINYLLRVLTRIAYMKLSSFLVSLITTLEYYEILTCSNTGTPRMRIFSFKISRMPLRNFSLWDVRSNVMYMSNPDVQTRVRTMSLRSLRCMVV